MEFADVQQSASSIFSSPSVGFEFRYSHHSLNNKELSKSPSSRASMTALKGHHHPHHPHHNDHHPTLKRRGKGDGSTPLKESNVAEDEEADEEEYQEEEYPETQRLLGWCDVSLQKSMERHVSRQNRRQR